MEYFEAFSIDKHQNPCKTAKEAAKEWIKKRLGEEVLIVKDYTPSTPRRKPRIVWIVYDGKHVYWIVIKCNTQEATVKVSLKKTSTRALKALAKTAKAQGLLARYPMLRAYT